MRYPPWQEQGDPEGLRSAVEQIVRQEMTEATPLTLARIEQWHRLLFTGRASPEEYVGRVRQRDPACPCLGQTVVAAGGHGRSAEVVPAEMAKLCERINQSVAKVPTWTMSAERKTLALANLLASVAVTFLRIHPFLDGNSRMVRLLLLVVTQRLGLPTVLAVLPPVTPAFSDLKRAAMQGEQEPWLVYLAEALAAGPGELGGREGILVNRRNRR